MGHIISSAISQSWPPSPHFSIDDIPDLTGKVIIVTGSNTGVGKVTVKALLLHNAKVYLAARNKEKAEAAIKELKEVTGKEAIFLELNLASLAAVRRAAEEFLSKESKLDVLYNNAGVMFPPIEQLTSDGYDMQFGTNVIGHFYLTKLLIPALLEGAKQSPDGKARVVTVASLGHLAHNGVSYESLTNTPQRTRKGAILLYGQSKCANIMFAKELAKRYGDQGIVSTSLNPGNLRTDLQRHTKGLENYFINKMSYPVDPLGALTQLWAGTSPETVDYNGKYLIPWARVGVPSSASQNDAECQKLWTWLEEQVRNV